VLETTVIWLDVAASPAGVPTVAAFERPLLHGDNPKEWGFKDAETSRTGEFWTPDGSLFSPDLSWSMTDQGTYVRIPIVTYQTHTKALAALWGLGLELGAKGLASLAEQTRKTPRRLVLVLGNACPEADAAFRASVGFSIEVNP
jgi:hypothetical protein